MAFSYHQTALCILLPEHLRPSVDMIRAQHDKAYPRWPSHVNLIWPFIEPQHFERVLEPLKILCAELKPFNITLPKLNHFDHNAGKKAVVYLEPSADGGGDADLQQLYTMLRSLLGSAVAGDDKARAFQPHFTLGQVDRQPKLEAEMAAQLPLPMQFECASISIIAKLEPDGKFNVIHTIPLMGTTALSSPSTVLNKLLMSHRDKVVLPPTTATTATIRDKNKQLSVILAVDATGSMGAACKAARTSFAEVSAQMNLLSGSKCVSMVAMADYDGRSPDSHQGGYARLEATATAQDLAVFTKKYIKPRGGPSRPEAYKTALNFILRGDVGGQPPPSILFLFLDAIPHGGFDNGHQLDIGGRQEKAFLVGNGMMWKWADIVSAVHAVGIRTVTFITGGSMTEEEQKGWRSLGDIVLVNSNTSRAITAAMMHVFSLLLIGTGTGTTTTTKMEDEDDDDDGDRGLFSVPSAIAPLFKLDVMARLASAQPMDVIDVFDSLLDSSDPTSALCLTTNPVLGKYWRAICGRFRYMEDRKYEKDCQRVIDTLSACSAKMSEQDRTVLKKWIDESHNDTSVIREWVCEAMKGDEDVALLQQPVEDVDGDHHIEGDGSDTAAAAQTHQHSEKKFLVLPRALRGSIDLDSVLGLGRGGHFAEVSKLISSLVIEEGPKSLPPKDDVVPDFIPLTKAFTADDPYRLFALIASLLSPGVTFSKIETFLVALLALQNQYLAETARAYLMKHKGQWIRWEVEAVAGAADRKKVKQLYPVFWSLNFMRLLKLADDDLLTDREKRSRDHYLGVAKVSANQDATIQIVTPLIIEAATGADLVVDVTYKRMCQECGQRRCFTIFPGDSRSCGFCVNKRVGREPLSQSGHNPSRCVDRSETHANWAQCKRCCGNYTVVMKHELNVRPTCHYCRGWNEPPLSECVECLGKFVDAGGSGLRAMSETALEIARGGGKENVALASRLQKAAADKKFICPRCAFSDAPKKTRHPTVMDHEVKISQVLTRNREVLEPHIPFTRFDTLFSRNTKLWVKARTCKGRKQDDDASKLLMLNDKQLLHGNGRGYTIHDSKGTTVRIMKTLTEHSGFETCPMCVEDVPVHRMKLACGNENGSGKCRVRLCDECIRGWYGQVEIGKVVQQTHTLCPFCKGHPSAQAISKLPLRYVSGIRPSARNPTRALCDWDHHTVYAVCRDCRKPRPSAAQECCAAAPGGNGRDNADDEVINFVCEACTQVRHEGDTVMRAGEFGYKPCPSCSVMTEHIGGCNHMTCGNCREHWCWVCSKKCTRDTIYDHLYEAHGGCFTVDSDEDDDDY